MGDHGREAEHLTTRIYGELRALAAHYLQVERAGHTLQPTALVHEAWVRLAGCDAEIANEQHFRAIAARVMRRVLLDHARRRGADKRGGGWLRVTLQEAATDPAEQQMDLIALEEALTELSALNTRKAEVVELRFFGGLTNEQVADILEISPKTAESDWYLARAWLLQRLAVGDP